MENKKIIIGSGRRIGKSSMIKNYNDVLMFIDDLFKPRPFHETREELWRCKGKRKK